MKRLNLMKKLILTILFFATIGFFLNCSTATTNSTNKQEAISPVNTNSTDSIDYNSVSYSLKNFDYVGECILSNYLSNDTLTIELLSENVHYSKKPHLEFVFNKDTLNITRTVETKEKDTIIFNKEKNKYDTLHLVEMSNMEIRQLDPKYNLVTFRFYKQRKMPTTIYVNGKLYKNCPTKDIEFKTYNGKIVNRINKDGFKDGVWLQFHENGKIKEEKYYDNGRFLNGKTFDGNGKDLHYVSESSGGIVTLQMDSLTNK